MEANKATPKATRPAVKTAGLASFHLDTVLGALENSLFAKGGHPRGLGQGALDVPRKGEYELAVF